jgi:hypothetical protein
MSEVADVRTYVAGIEDTQTHRSKKPWCVITVLRSQSSARQPKREVVLHLKDSLPSTLRSRAHSNISD